MYRLIVGGLLAGAVLLSAHAQAQQPAQTCKEMPARCDKELLLLRGEVDNKRQAIAVLLDANGQLQGRAEKAEARVRDLENAAPVVTPSEPIPADTTPPPK